MRQYADENNTGQTDGRTDGLTDTPSYRDATAHIKSGGKKGKEDKEEEEDEEDEEKEEKKKYE